MSFATPKIIVTCPVCKVEVAPNEASDLLEWWPRHCAVMKQCIKGDPREMVQDFERQKEKMANFQQNVTKKLLGDTK